MSSKLIGGTIAATALGLYLVFSRKQKESSGKLDNNLRKETKDTETQTDPEEDEEEILEEEEEEIEQTLEDMPIGSERALVEALHKLFGSIDDIKIGNA